MDTVTGIRFKRYPKTEPRVNGYTRWGARRYRPWGWTIFAGPFVIWRDNGPLNVWWAP